MKNQRNYYVGLDIGTDSVGYAVTDEKYNLLKFHGEPAWGVTIFDPASLNTERRSFRIARRRLDRRQQRVSILQELFAEEISKIDPRFFVRIQESRLFREDTGDKNTLFDDVGYTDKEYYAEYPTIHHLICELMNNGKPHDVRLVYLACAWLVAHRGHFLSNISTENLAKIKDVNMVYAALMAFFTDNGYDMPWGEKSAEEFGRIIKEKAGISRKTKKLTEFLYDGGRASKELSDSFPFSREAIVKLICGGTCKVSDIYGKEEYKDYGSISLGMDDEKLSEFAANLGEDFELILTLRTVYDWAVLADILGESETISEAKVLVYEQHRTDLQFLKKVIKEYLPDKYNEVFRNTGKPNYAAYSYHSDEADSANLKKVSAEEFSKFLLGIVRQVKPKKQDEEQFVDMVTRLELRRFLPKQKTTDNRVIPHQLYWYELRKILENASEYLPLLNQKEDGLTVKEKIESVFLFKIPYFVGPLNPHSEYAWLKREEGKIYPWNFEEKVNLDESERRFIAKLTNTCTYLPGERVLPLDSFLYHRFTVLNEINNLRINGTKIPVSLKQDIFNNLFMKMKKVTRKKLTDYLICNGVIEKGEEGAVTGIDININANLSSQIAFRRLMDEKVICESDAERIIERASYAEDKSRLSGWLVKEYPQISEEDRKYICRLKLKDFGRLSRKFLSELEGASKDTGEASTIIEALWNTQDNLMELLSDRYTFAYEIGEYRKEYYSANPMRLEEKLDKMYVSNSVKRPIFRTLAIMKDIEKAFGTPKKIFVETTRGATEEQKGRRTVTRKQQILNLYKKCSEEDVRELQKQLEAMGEYADNKLQSDKLFLYYLQLGKSMYSGKPIELEKLGSKEYDIDHIYPQAYVKDDSLLNNKVLVLSEENGLKSDIYPINESIRKKMHGYWRFLKDSGLITEEKYKRLTRNTPFTNEEKLGFINRQLTETSQSTKAVAELLKERYQDAGTEIVYCKARLVSEFRQEFDLPKSRVFNDLHHAVDAYLNIVTGNVYHMKFTGKWFSIDSKYSLKTKTLFTRPVIIDGRTIWDGDKMLARVKATAQKNTAHFTKYAFFRRGGLFDQMPVSAAEGLVPIKKELPTEKYGGYNKAGAACYLPVRYKAGKKTDILVMSVEMLFVERFLADDAFARSYSRTRLKHILGKEIDDVTFPMGMRPWKVNTMLELDGFRVCIAGISGGGKCLIAQPVMQFSEKPEWNAYLKHAERLVEKVNQNANYIYDEKYDGVSADRNKELYAIYLRKYTDTIFRKRINVPLEILKNGKDKFNELSIIDQTRAILNIQMTFGRTAGGCDLRLIGGAERSAATVNFSSNISNWKKNYSCIRIVDSSVSGMWAAKSVNLLDLL